MEKMDGSMTQEEFSKESIELIKASDEIGDEWMLVANDHNSEPKYLKYHQKVQISGNLYRFEYHIVYSVSYQVPVLYFKINRDDGSNVSLEEAWSIFKQTDRLLQMANEQESYQHDMFKILTQMEHPHLFVPFLALHPCRTAEILAMNPRSKNRILTFVSTVGPFVQLYLNQMYGKIFD